MFNPRQFAVSTLLLLSLVGCSSQSDPVSPESTNKDTTAELSVSVSYRYLPFDVPAELGAFTTAFGNNNWGAIVGNFGAADESVHGFLFDGHHFVDVVVPGSVDDHGSLSDINDFGVATGGFTDAGTEIGHAYLRNWKGKITVLSDPAPDAVSTEGSGINNFGTVVGTFFDEGGLAHGFIWRFGHSTVYDYPGAVRTRLNGLNDRGQIAGQWSDADRHQHGFVIDGSHLRAIEFPGATDSRATAINDRGQVIGFYNGDDGVWHGFIYSGGSYTALDYPGSSSTVPFGINNWGVIVGTYDDFSRGMVAVPLHG